MVKILLYSSQLAAFIGRNPHTSPSRIFNKLFEKYYEKELLGIKSMKRMRDINVGDGGVIENYSNKMVHNKDFRFKLDTLCKNNLSSIDLKKEAESLVSKVLEVEKLSKEDSEMLKKAVEGYTNKTFGTIREVNVVDVYRERMGVDVVTKLQSRVKTVYEYEGNELMLISKIDAMKMDGTVLEIKNRMYKIFEEVREYEWLQVQAYLEVYNLDRAELVEFLKVGDGEMKVNEIGRDRRYWGEIVMKDLGNYFRVMIRLVGDVKKLKKYVGMTETEQNEMIKKMVRREAKG